MSETPLPSPSHSKIDRHAFHQNHDPSVPLILLGAAPPDPLYLNRPAPKFTVTFFHQKFDPPSSLGRHSCGTSVARKVIFAKFFLFRKFQGCLWGLEQFSWSALDQKYFELCLGLMSNSVGFSEAMKLTCLNKVLG